MHDLNHTDKVQALHLLFLLVLFFFFFFCTEVPVSLLKMGLRALSSQKVFCIDSYVAW